MPTHSGTPLELWRQFRAESSLRLRNQIVTQNMGLVYKCARSFSERCAESREDLEQIGVIGLIKAITNYDPDTGNKFSSIAVPWINGEILHYLRDNRGLTKVPRSYQETFDKVRKRAIALQKDFELVGRLEAIEQCMNIVAQQMGVRNWSDILWATRYLPHTEISELSEVLADERQETSNYLQLMAKLPTPQLEALKEHVFKGKTTNQLGLEQGLSKLRELINA